MITIVGLLLVTFSTLCIWKCLLDGRLLAAIACFAWAVAGLTGFVVFFT